MKNLKRALLLLVIAGCQAGPTMEAGQGAAIDPVDMNVRPLARPTGTYRASMDFDPSVNQWTAGDMLTLTFMVDRAADGTITRRFRGERLVYCAATGGAPTLASIMGPCSPREVTGTYRFVHGDRDRNGREYDYIYINTGAEREIHFAYYPTLAEDGHLRLNLRQVRTTGWAVYEETPENAWCASPADCNAQELPHARCPGRWECNEVEEPSGRVSPQCAYEACNAIPTCPLTGVQCSPECVDGHTPGGGPCNLGEFDTTTCECNPIQSQG